MFKNWKIRIGMPLMALLTIGGVLFGIGAPAALAAPQLAATSYSYDTRPQDCIVDHTFTGNDGKSHHITGYIRTRVAYIRNNTTDAVYVNWPYNWPGTDAGEGTGISVENHTNFILSFGTTHAYKNNAQGQGLMWSDSVPMSPLHTTDRAHIAGISDWADYPSLTTGSPDYKVDDFDEGYQIRFAAQSATFGGSFLACDSFSSFA